MYMYTESWENRKENKAEKDHPQKFHPLKFKEDNSIIVLLIWFFENAMIMAWGHIKTI